MKRSYVSVDEMVFRDARDKGDATSKRMYKQVQRKSPTNSHRALLRAV